MSAFDERFFTWGGYNNSGVAAVAIGATLNHCKYLSLPKILLVMPLVMHAPTVKYLANGKMRSREIFSLIAVRPDFVHNFDQRYQSSLIHTVNAIQILNSLDFIEYDGFICQKKAFEVTPAFGARAKQIAAASKEISRLLGASEEELYLNLRVQL